MAFYTILTDIGKAKLANATALGSVVSLTEIAVGDGGGVAVVPATTDTVLTNEVWRAALNNISIDSSNANWVVAEGYIPSTDGDFTVREVGLFDVDGDMIAVGNYPDTYKPTLASGSAKDLYIKVIIEVSDAGVVELKIDPAVVLSTRKYVDDEVAKRALLGGSATKIFKAAAGVASDDVVNKGQLDLKVNLADVYVNSTADSIPIRDSDTAIFGKNQCTAWVNFDGTDGTIRDSYNIASVVRNGTGSYTVNFSKNMNNTNFVVAGIGNYSGTAYRRHLSTLDDRSISYFKLESGYGDSATNRFEDFNFVTVVIFGGK